MLVFTACSKRDDDIHAKVAKEIKAEEVLNLYIVEEYQPKPEHTVINGTKPYLQVTYIQLGTNNTVIAYSCTGDAIKSTNTEFLYNPENGITILKTIFGNYELTRDDDQQIIGKKSNHNPDSYWFLSKYFTSQYIQVVKTTGQIFHDAVYKAISGNAYYGFSINKWKYNSERAPYVSELTWNYTRANNSIWYGNDGGTAHYYNLFLILPKGNGWKGQHKDKDLLLVNTLDLWDSKAVGDIGIYYK
jgi:hypothetical protein